MAGIRTYESFAGFIASTPNTEPTGKGKPRFYAHAGQNQFRKEEDGHYTKTGTEYVPIVAYDRVAEELAARFARGDTFVAEGYTRPFSYQKDGQTVEGEEFVIWRVGHDAIRTPYTVERVPRTDRTPDAGIAAAQGSGSRGNATYSRSRRPADTTIGM